MFAESGCRETCLCGFMTCKQNTHDTSCLSSIRGRKPRQWSPWLCQALTYLLVFICWVPQITLTLPQVHKWGHFLNSKSLKTFTPSAMCCCPSFFLFHRRALRFQPIRHKVPQTQQIVPTACQVTRLVPWTQLRCSSSNCPSQVREVKVCLIKNELSPMNFFQFAKHPKLGSRSKGSSN